MTEAPRKKDDSFFSKGLGFDIIWQGAMIGILSLTSYAIGNFIGDPLTAHEIGQTMAFLTLSTCQLFHAFNIKSHHSIFSKQTFNNKFLILAFVLGLTLQILVTYIPGLNAAFNLVALDMPHLFIALGLGAVTVVICEIVKLIKKISKK